MDRASLEQWLGQGLSLEKIAKRVGRDPSTVGYWVRKYGLIAAYKEKHAPRGGIDRKELEGWVDRGASFAEMARHFNVSQHTVGYWLRRHGLRTRASRNRELQAEARRAGMATVRRKCRHHGMTEFLLEGSGRYRCLRCRQERVASHRRKIKRILVDEAGGKCCLCGYDRYVGALQFHHLDPSQKRFPLSLRGITRSIDAVRAEARKCVLLCANCHAEVEAGYRDLDTPQLSLAR
jgi:transposase